MHYFILLYTRQTNNDRSRHGAEKKDEEEKDLLSIGEEIPIGEMTLVINE